MLDHFKKVNDEHGHAVGDQYLIHTSKTMRESLRHNEIIGRYGGDEFAILLPGSNEAQSLHVAERLRQKMISQPIITTRGKQVVTLSLGIAEFSQTKDNNLEALLARADQALYAAKHRGRNQAATYSQLRH
jgi:diguanylate cyclase (GGDEF)-like protein